MRRTVSYDESRIDISAEQQTKIRKRLGNSAADAFIDAARLAGGEYKAKAAAWIGQSPADVRKAIEHLGRACAAAQAAIESLPVGAEGWIQQGQALDQSQGMDRERRLHPDLSRSMDTKLERLEVDLRRIAAACTRAAVFKAFNQGQGNEPDYARRALIRELGDAYRTATGKEPACRSQGVFAGIAQIVLTAAGADSGISNDLLRSIFGPSAKSR